MESLSIENIKNKTLTSKWLVINQSEINDFGEVTKDLDPLHVDPDYAAKGPFGTTIAFGFYSLSLLTYFSHELIEWEKYGHGLNYGFNNIRFLEPVKVGSKIRAHFTLVETKEKSTGTLLKFKVTVEINGSDKPALIAEWLGLLVSDTKANIKKIT